MGGRGQTGYVLGRSGAAAVAWYLAGGAPMPIACYQPKGAASLAASYINLANPGTYNAAPGVAPTFDPATGWAFNGATQYLTTGVVPTASTTVLVRFSGATADGVYTLIGSRTANYGMRNRVSNSRQYFLATTATGTGAGVDAGVMAIVGNQGYYNGAADGGTMTTGTYSFPLFIAALNNLGGPAQWWGGNIQAVAIYAATLSAAQVAAIAAAVALI